MGDNRPPINRRPMSPDAVLRLIEARSIPEPNTGCILWQGGVRNPRAEKNRQYGTIRLNGRESLVHRVMFEAAYRCTLDSRAHVLHRCDTPLCVNVDHLFVGTNDENNADKAAKDRGRKRLTHEKALKMHEMAAAGIRQTVIAREFDVDRSIVSRILAGKRRPLARLSTNQE